jgi:hypothetical protein
MTFPVLAEDPARDQNEAATPVAPWVDSGQGVTISPRAPIAPPPHRGKADDFSPTSGRAEPGGMNTVQGIVAGLWDLNPVGIVL